MSNTVCILVAQCGKRKNLLSLKKQIRQINHLAISLVYRYFHEIFAKSVSRTVWKLREFSHKHIWKKFRESNGFDEQKVW